MSDPASSNHPMLRLTEGGPTYRIEKRLGLIREQSPRVVRRVFFFIVVTWVPLLVLSALQGTAIGDSVVVPFLRDIALHARLLLAMPLLILAEVLLGPHLAEAAIHFVDSGLVPEEDFKRFDNAVERALRWRDSLIPELVFLLLAYTFATMSWRSMAIHVSTWHAITTDPTVSLTWAGWWLVLFCTPFFQFLLLRWFWRLFLWGQFLWRMSKLHLQLIPTHPDEAAGLAFVGKANQFFSMVLLSASIAAAGTLANSIVYDNIPLPHFGPVIAVYVFFAVLIFIAPLCVFSPILIRTKRIGIFQYGTLATEYASSFHKKWIGASSPREEGLLGTADIQSLADLGNSFSFIEDMRPLPTGPRTLAIFALACLIPMFPLLLTMMPLKELLKAFVKFML